MSWDGCSVCVSHFRLKVFAGILSWHFLTQHQSEVSNVQIHERIHSSLSIATDQPKTSITFWWKHLSFDPLDIILCLYALPHCRYSQLLIALKPQERWKQLKRARGFFLFRNGPDSPVKGGLRVSHLSFWNQDLLCSICPVSSLDLLWCY